jgi:hypothetical protein
MSRPATSTCDSPRTEPRCLTRGLRSPSDIAAEVINQYGDEPLKVFAV